MKYGILGSGDATASAVQECLMDIVDSDKDVIFLIHARRKPQGAVPYVYDFIVDNEVDFVSYTRVDDNAPKPLIEGAKESHKTDDPLMGIIRDSDKILLLWDEQNNESSEKIAIRCADAGKEILDLTMALTPVVVNPSDTKTETSPFTKEELLEMPVGVLRNQAKALGMDMSRAKKDEIIEALLNIGNSAPEVASDVHVPTVPMPGLNGVLVYTDDGVIRTMPLDSEVVAQLLSRSS